jgi:hypothetical protein
LAPVLQRGTVLPSIIGELRARAQDAAFMLPQARTVAALRQLRGR